MLQFVHIGRGQVPGIKSLDTYIQINKKWVGALIYGRKKLFAWKQWGGCKKYGRKKSIEWKKSGGWCQDWRILKN